jgi:hypothetical protein
MPVNELEHYLLKAQSAIAQRKVGMVWLRFFVTIGARRGRGLTCYSRGQAKREGLAIKLCEGTIATRIFTRKIPHDLCKRTIDVRLGHSVLCITVRRSRTVFGIKKHTWRIL